MITPEKRKELVTMLRNMAIVAEIEEIFNAHIDIQHIILPVWDGNKFLGHQDVGTKFIVSIEIAKKSGEIK